MPTSQHEPVDPRVLGQRLAEARRARGLTQEEVAIFLGYSRPTYIAIEKGERATRAEELIRLCEHLGRSVSEIVRPGAFVVEFKPHLRAALDTNEPEEVRAGLDIAIDAFQKLAADYRRLEDLANAPRKKNYPPELRLGPHSDPLNMAETAANQERQRLGLGDQPVLDLRSLLENEVGARVFYWPMPSSVSGMYAFTEDLGICVMINLLHPEVRRRWSSAHEYAHAIADRFSPGIDYSDLSARKPANERFADAFAMAFLMPAAAVKQRFYETLNSRGDFNVADLVRLSHHFWVALSAMTLRLEQLDLVKKGMWRLLSEDHLSPTKMAAALGLEERKAPGHRFPERYVSLAVSVYDAELITERELAAFLRCSLIDARKLVEECRSSPDGQSSNIRLSFNRSLLDR